MVYAGYTLPAMRRRSRAIVAASGLVVAGALAGCGAGTVSAKRGLKPTPLAGVGTATSMVGGGRLSKRAPGSLARRALSPVGRTQAVDASGAKLEVTLTRVIDPLRSSGAELPPRTRAVGVVVTIRSSGPALYDSSATGDISLMSSAGVAMPVLATRGICHTPLNDFDRYITAGEHRAGCVVFAVPDGATLDAVRFSPHAHQLGRLTWAP